MPPFPGYPQCGGSMPQQAMRTFSQPRSGIRARNVAMPWPPRIQLRQVQDQDEKVMRSFQRFGQLTWSKSRDRPGQGFLGPAREHSTSRGKGTPSSHQGCCVRLEADNPHFQIGSVTYTTSNTPIGRQTGGGRDEGLT